jgi:ribokinase
VPADLAARTVREGRPAVVVGQFEIPQAVTLAAFRAAREIGAVTVLNPAPAAPIDPELLAVTDWLVPNETEFAAIAGAALDGTPDDEERGVAEAADRLGVGLVVTIGERGALLAAPGGPVERVPTDRVEAVDTTGAGDAFVAGFAVGTAMGLAPGRAAALGCAVASDSVTRPGTQRAYADAVAAPRILARIVGDPDPRH